MLTLGMVFLWFSLQQKEKVREGDVVQVCCQLSISDMITPLPSRETDGDSEDVAVYLKKFPLQLAGLEHFLSLNGYCNRIQIQSCLSLPVTYELRM